MAEAIVRGGFDSWVGSSAPNATHGSNVGLRLLAGTPANRAFVYLKNPAPRGAVVTSATLRVHAWGASSGSRTVTLRRVSASWKAARVTWNNQPGTISGTAAQATASIGSLTNGQAIEFDVTEHIQSIVNGSPHYGWRIETSSTTNHVIHSFDSGSYIPTLTVEWADEPSTPTTLIPSSGAVSVDRPVLQFDYSDVTGDDLVAVQVLVDPDANPGTGFWDSGEVPTTVPELNLAYTTYPGLADGGTTQWCVRVKDSGGLWSGYSDWATFSRDSKGTLTIDSPGAAPNDYVTEATPPILWTFTGETQDRFRVRIFDADDRTRMRYDSGVIRSSVTGHDLPELWKNQRILVDDRRYSLNVRVWDAKDREATPGDPTYVEAWRDFTMNDDLTVPAPTLTVSQDGVTPWVTLDFTRATAPDSWTIRRDGTVIASNVDATETSTGGTSYRWRDESASPQAEHSYTVQAVVNRKAGAKSNVATIFLAPQGIWLLDRARDLDVLILGQDAGSWAMPDQAATYTPIGAQGSVRIVTGMRGLEGSLSGTIADAHGRKAKDEEATLMRIKERPARVYRLVAGDVSIPVYLGDITVAPTPLGEQGDLFKAVSFSFWQAGDLPFDARF